MILIMEENKVIGKCVDITPKEIKGISKKSSAVRGIIISLGVIFIALCITLLIINYVRR